MQKDKRIIETKPTSIAVERFFYGIGKLSELDLKWINNLIDKAAHPEQRELHRRTLRNFSNISEIRSLVEQHNNPSNQNLDNLLKKIDELEKTIGEKWHTSIENSSEKLLEHLKSCDAAFYEIQALRFDFISYLTHQFFRTPKLRRLQARTENPFKAQGLDLDRTWFFESQIYATNISADIVREGNLYNFKFICNQTRIPFITGDQPVVSLGPDENGLRFYYPLSPNLAMVFEKDNTFQLQKTIQATVLQVEFYNSLIHRFSYEQVYSNERPYLEIIKALPKNLLDA